MTLGHHLGTQQNIGFLSGKTPDDLLMSHFGGRAVLVHTQYLNAGHLADLLFRFLGTAAEEFDPPAATMGAGFRNRIRIPAIMTPHSLFIRMKHQTDRTVRTGQRFPAVPAHDKGGIAPTVQQHNSLLVCVYRRNELPAQLPGNDGIIFLRQFFPHIHHVHSRQKGTARTAFQLQMTDPPRNRAEIGFQGRRGAAQDQHGPAVLTPVTRHFPGVVGRTFLLFITGLLFLVYHYEAQILKRGEDRASHPDQHIGFPGAHLVPDVAPFILRQLAVGHGHFLTEPGLKPLHDLRRQRNFRYQHQHLLSLPQSMVGSPQIHLGLTAAGNPL